MTLQESITKAKKIIIDNQPDKFALIYPFATENIDGYLSKYDLRSKSVLSVGSSNDQVINSYMLGANVVDSFDINPFTKFFFDLKKAAILALSYEEYLEFFCYYNYPKKYARNKNAFSLESFNKIRIYLNGDSLVFWSTLFNTFSGIRIRKKLFSKDEDFYKVVIHENAYLTRENFYILKKKIQKLKPTFYNVDFRDVSGHLNRKYDYIMLSNIAMHIESMYESPIQEFARDIKNLAEFINENGVMFISYLYDYDEKTKVKPYWDLIYQREKIINSLKDYKVFLESFVGVSGLIYNKEKMKDSVLVLKK